MTTKRKILLLIAFNAFLTLSIGLTSFYLKITPKSVPFSAVQNRFKDHLSNDNINELRDYTLKLWNLLESAEKVRQASRKVTDNVMFLFVVVTIINSLGLAHILKNKNAAEQDAAANP